MTGRGQTSRAAEGSALERQTQELAELYKIVHRQSEQIEKLLQHQQDRQEPPLAHLPPPPPPPPQAPATLHPLEPFHKLFRKQHPPVFESGIDPFDAEEWINSIENFFDFMQLNEREKVSCASYMLKKDARIWWDVVK